MKVCAVTCTGSRPELFALCASYVASQDRKIDHWIVVSDVPDEPVLTPDGVEFLNLSAQIHSVNTFNPANRSLSLALRLVPDDHATLILEDDDYYGPGYTQQMLDLLDGFGIAGSSFERRYNMDEAKWINKVKATGPNAASTIIKPGGAPLYAEWLLDRSHGHSWWAKNGLRPNWERRDGIERVAIKGAGRSLPGRGNATGEPSSSWTSDPGHKQLRKWIGDDNAQRYISLARKRQN